MYKARLDFGLTETSEVNLQDVVARKKYLSAQLMEHATANNGGLYKNDRAKALAFSYVDSVLNNDESIWSTGFSCSGPQASAFYVVPNDALNDWVKVQSSKEQYDEMKTLFEGYCKYIGEQVSYEDPFAKNWWNTEKGSVNTDLIKNLDWFMPGR